MKIRREPRIISREEFFGNSKICNKYKMNYKIYPTKEFYARKKSPIHGIKINGSPVDIDVERDREEITRLYEDTVNTIIREIKQSIPNDKTEQLKAVFNYMVRRCKYWDDYPRSGGFMAKAQKAEIRHGGRTYIAENYNSKEVAILAGYSVCNGLADAFKDIARRLGIDCEVVQNGSHGWNMVYTDEGPRYIDCSLAVEHFRGKNPNLKKTIKRNYPPEDYFMVDENRLRELERMPNRYCFPHGDGVIVGEKITNTHQDIGLR